MSDDPSAAAASPGGASLRIGLLQLADSAPVLVAQAYGLFARRGIAATIAIEPSWANLADKLTWRMLDAAVMFTPLALMTAAGRRGRPAPLHLVEPLSRGGNTIVLRGTTSTTWDDWYDGFPRRPRLAVVHIHSTHHLLLRRHLTAQGVDFDRDIDLVVMPPARIVEALETGALDGFCAGSPWGAEAILRGLGFELAGSRQILPGHLEKSLFVTSGWLAADPARAGRLHGALTEAKRLCADPANRADIAALLAAPVADGGLDLPLEATASVLPGGAAFEQLDFSPQTPISATEFDTLLAEMRALDWIDADTDARILLEPAPPT